MLEYLELELHLMDTRPGVKPEEFIVELVKRWMSRDTERLAVRSGGLALRGFQWKTLFLPEGTILRTGRDSSVEFAKVCGDRIIADDGAALTPSLFANSEHDRTECMALRLAALSRRGSLGPC